MPNTPSTPATNATDQIEDLQRQIEQLKHRAVLELKVKLAEARAQVVEIQAQIDKLAAGEAGEKPTATGRKRRTRVTIGQIVEAIKGGATNYRSVAAKLGASPAAIANKIKDEGKAAGISSTGKKAAFKLVVK